MFKSLKSKLQVDQPKEEPPAVSSVATSSNAPEDKPKGAPQKATEEKSTAGSGGQKTNLPESPGSSLMSRVLRAATITDSKSAPPSPASKAEAEKTLSPEETARIEASSRAELIAMLTKQQNLSRRYQRKLTDLVAAYKDVQTSNSKLESALEKQQDEMVRRTRDLSEMNKQGTDAKNKLIEALKKQNERLQEDVDKLQNQSKSHQAESRELKESTKETAILKQEIKKLKTQQGKLEEKLNSAAANVQSLKKSNTALEKEKRGFNQRIEELSLSLKQKQIDIQTQMKLVDELRNSIKTREGSKSDQIDKVKALEHELQGRNSDFLQLKTKISGEQDKVRSLEEQIKLAEEDMARKKEEWKRREERLKEDLNQASEAKTAADKRIQTSETESEKRRVRVRELEELLEEHVVKIVALEDKQKARMSEENNENTGANTTSNNEAEMRELEEKVELLHSQLKIAKSEARRAADARDAETRQVAALKERLNDGDIKIARIKEDVENARKDCEEASKEKAVWKIKYDGMEQEVQKLRSTLQVTTQQGAAMEQLTSTLQQTVKEKSSQLGSIQDQLTAKSENLISVTAEVEALTVKLASATTTLESLRNEQATTIATAKTREDAAVRRAEAAESNAEELSTSVSLLKDQVATLEASLKSSESQLEDVQTTGQNELSNVKIELNKKSELLEKAEQDLVSMKEELSEAVAKADKAETDLKRITSREEAARKQVDELAEELGQVTIRLRREEAAAASNKYTADTQAVTLQAVREAKRDTDARILETERILREARSEVSKAMDEKSKLEAALATAESSLKTAMDSLDSAETQVQELTSKLKESTSTIAGLEGQCRSLETQAKVSEEALNEITTKYEDVKKTADEKETELTELKKELAVVKQEAEEAKGKLEEAERAKISAEDSLATAIQEHQIATRKQLQHAAELKKTLQRSLRADSITNIGNTDTRPSTPPTEGRISPAPGTTPSSQTGTPTYPDHLEVNFLYLKNIILKYMTSQNEASQLLKVISTVLRFSAEEEKRVQTYINQTQSWGLW
eukprot:m.57410 g.57410  ORF g.57410 m.57410 type:complete len:1042 (-) comp11107_c0_seq1:595-3720(-)